MNKIMKKIVTVVLALTMVIGTVMSVSAAVIPAPPNKQDDGAALIQKALKVPNGFEVPSLNFQFLFTPQGVTNDATGAVIVAGATGYVNPVTQMPRIGVEKSGTTTNEAIVTILGTEVATGVSDPVDGMQMFKFSKNVFAATSGNAVTGASFPHAGVYKYIISEIDEESANPSMKYSNATYEMYVYVANKLDEDDPPALDTPESRYIANVGFRIMSVDGDDITTETMPALVTEDKETGTDSTYPKHEPVFTNRFDPPADLEVDKTVAGTYADITKMFNYKLTVKRPVAAANVDKDQVYVGTIYDGATATTQTVTVTFTGTEVDGVVTSTTTPSTEGVAADAQFTLKHGQKLDFLDTPATPEPDKRTGLPAGSTYTITEIGEARYTASAGIWNNSASLTETATATSAGATLAIAATDISGDNNSLVLGAGKNWTDWTNTHTDVTPTGILMNNLPFILLIVVSIGGFVGYIASKRRKASN